ncbi:MAG: VPS10 domain-containing protein [Terriglobales bacterium]
MASMWRRCGQAAAAVAAVAALAAAVGAAAPSGGVSPSLYKGMKWRLIGPFRGGRVEAVTGVPGQADTYYFGAVAGGVWKTTDAGATWRPLFDHEPTQAIGAIAVAPSDPNVIYVGTGESDPRGDSTYGDGMYKSVDAGQTWTPIGLERTRHIAAIVVDPRNPNRLWVAALGRVYGASSERGVYRSEDGGRTWQRVLYVNDQSGATDVAMDPRNPRILFAALWQVRRWPWKLVSGGPGSGLFRSMDGGATWTRIAGHGFPAGVLGKISVAVAANGRRVYAQVEAQEGGLYASEDLGHHWKLVNSSESFRQRAWYFTHILADPVDPNTVYEMNVNFFRSTDGGEIFHRMHVPHGDNHAMWIAPHHPNRMIVGNDGGATISLTGGQTWSTLDNQPTAQFYHVALDRRVPFYAYGAQQDNSSVAIASASKWGAITARDWYPVGGGESGYIAPDPLDYHIVYAGAYFGILTRFNLRTGLAQDISVWPDDPDGRPAAEQKLRFTWTAPLIFSPENPHVLYTAAQYLFESADGGMSWRQISPDLTRNDKSKQGPSGGPITKDQASAEYYDLIYTIAPSPRRAGEIWIGTDDGFIQLTLDGGRTWRNVTPPALPAWSNVSLIDASPFDPASAYAAVNGYKNGDKQPMIFITHDYGRTWTKDVEGLPRVGPVRVVREDPVRRGLLYCGTESGVFVSFNDGGNWQPLQLNLPHVPIRDLAIQNGELVAATHGRSFWILDDLSPLRQIQPGMAARAVFLYRPETAYLMHLPSEHVRPGMAAGQNPPSGAVLDYYLQAAPTAPVRLAVYDARGKLVRRFSSVKHKVPPPPKDFYAERARPSPVLPVKAGMNRFVWNLRGPRPKAIRDAIYDEGNSLGISILPGQYRAVLTVAGHDYSQPLTVEPDPRHPATLAALTAQHRLMEQLRAGVAADHQAVFGLQALRQQLTALQRHLQGDAAAAPVSAAAQRLDAQALHLEQRLYQYQATAGEAMLNYPIELNSKLGYLENAVDSAETAPTAQQQAYAKVLLGHLQQALARWKQLQMQELAALNRQIKAAHIPPLFVPKE